MNNINNVDTDKTNDTVNDAIVTIRRKKPKKTILIIAKVIIILKSIIMIIIVAIKTVQIRKIMSPCHRYHKILKKMCLYLEIAW